MCLILIAYDCHPKYKLIIAGNRDEFYRRPTLSARFWPENPSILAGKDLITGGTWSGITTSGRFAAVTVYREPIKTLHLKARGPLASEYLRGDDPPQTYLQKLVETGVEYKGFSLLAGSVDCLYYLSNRENMIHKLDSGLHGLSNNLLNVPWPKVTKGLSALSTCLEQEDVRVEDIFEIMADRETPPDEDLPDTGVGLERERLLGSACIISPQYGTRATTVILVDRTNRVHFWERSLETDSERVWKDVHFEFQVGQD